MPMRLLGNSQEIDLGIIHVIIHRQNVIVVIM